MTVIPSKNICDTGEIYSTDNFLIKYLSYRFIKKIEELLDDLQVSQLNGIDIGSAEGQLLSILIKKGKIKKICSIELEHEKICASILHQYNHQFIQCDAQNLSCKDDSFDFVMATEILEHLPKPEKALQEICRIAKPKAPIIISVPHEPFFHLGNILRGKHLARGGKTPSHLHFWHKSEFTNLLKNHLVIERSFSFSTFPWLLYCCRNNK